MAAMTIFWILQAPECPIFRFRYRVSCNREQREASQKGRLERRSLRPLAAEFEVVGPRRRSPESKEKTLVPQGSKDSSLSLLLNIL